MERERAKEMERVRKNEIFRVGLRERLSVRVCV